MSPKPVVAVLIVFSHMCLGGGVSYALVPNLKDTLIVDPQNDPDDANFATIQDAIASFGPLDVSVKKTILIYSGTYQITSRLALGGNRENVDLVGVDRDAVIIEATNVDAIVITSGLESSRKNSIRNLTIKTLAPGGGGGEAPGPASNRVRPFPRTSWWRMSCSTSRAAGRRPSRGDQPTASRSLQMSR